jgi:hypothetical protein
MDSATLRQLFREESALLMEQWRMESVAMFQNYSKHFESRLQDIDNRHEVRLTSIAGEVQKLHMCKDASTNTTQTTQLSLSVNAALRGQPEPDAIDEMVQLQVQAWLSSSGDDDHQDYVPSWAKGVNFNETADLQQASAVNCQLTSTSRAAFASNAGSWLGDAADNAVAAADKIPQPSATRLTESWAAASGQIGDAPENAVQTATHAPEQHKQLLSTKLLKEHMARVNPRACLLCRGTFKHTRYGLHAKLHHSNLTLPQAQ